MSLPQSLNQNSYLLPATGTSAYITLTGTDITETRLRIVNLGSFPAIVLSGGNNGAAAPTAVYPTSTGTNGQITTTAEPGQVIAAGAIEVFSKNGADQYVAAICSGSNTTTLMISPATGD